MNRASKIEALLFYKAEPVTIQRLADLLESNEHEIEESISELENTLSSRGIALIREGDEVALGTNPEASELIETLNKQELEKDLGKAALETLTIVLYKTPVSKSEIDYIRGVNSSFILRNLLIRGLIKREHHPIDKRAFLYRPTIDLLSYVGVGSVEDLPEYNSVQKQIKEFEETFEKQEQNTKEEQTNSDNNSEEKE